MSEEDLHRQSRAPFYCVTCGRPLGYRGGDLELAARRRRIDLEGARLRPQERAFVVAVVLAINATVAAITAALGH